MSDCLVVGGGIIGLSLAYELAGHAMRVRVIDAGQPGQQASWAGAGILPPAICSAEHPMSQLTALSNRLHAEWAETLRAATGIDNGYRRTGAIYLARDAHDAEHLERFAAEAHQCQVDAQRLSPAAISSLEPVLRPTGSLESAYLVPDECQIRNPRHLKALVAACIARGVEITSGAAAEDFETRGGRIRRVITCLGAFSADTVCLTSGAWTAHLARKLGPPLEIVPVRGQMALLAVAAGRLQRIVNEGKRYLVPRDDGRVLVGSTEEEVGFDRGTTCGAIQELLSFALSLADSFAAAPVERYWAGLRPATRDGLPYLGRVSGLENVFLAAGHFRSGLQLSTGTAVVMGQLIRAVDPQVDISAFGLDRECQRGHRAADATLPRQRALPQH